MNDQDNIQQVFVIISYSTDHLKIYWATIKPVLEKLGLNPIIAQEIEHNDDVTTVFLDAIDNSKLIIADITGEKPNVYYEIGWAHKAGKEVILLAKKDTNIHFNIAGLNKINYADEADLSAYLIRRIDGISEKLGLSIKYPAFFTTHKQHIGIDVSKENIEADLKTVGEPFSYLEIYRINNHAYHVWLRTAGKKSVERIVHGLKIKDYTVSHSTPWFGKL